MKLPKEYLNAEIRKLPRPMDSTTEMLVAWQGGEIGLSLLWPDGFVAFASFGPEATAIIQSHQETRH